MKKFAKFFMAMVMISSLAIAGCGDAKKKEEGKDAKKDAKASTPADSNVATKEAPATNAMTTVSVKLPKMT